MTTKRADHPLAATKLAVPLASALATGMGAMVLVGWALDITALKSVLPGWVSMKPNAALGFVLTGIALLFSAPPTATIFPQHSAFVARFARLCGLLAGLIGLLTLAEYVSGWHPGIDQWLIAEPAGTVGTSTPGRMAPDTALCFVLLAAALEIVREPHSTVKRLLVLTALGTLVTSMALTSILAYLAPTLGPYGWWGTTIMAVPTAVVFAVLGATMVLVAWQQGASMWSLDARIMAAFACGLAVLVFVGLNTSRGQVRLHELADDLARSEMVLERTARFLAAMASTQSRALGYVITGDEPILKSYISADTRSKEALDTLRQLTADNPLQQPRFAKVEAQAREALQLFHDNTGARRTGPSAVHPDQIRHGEVLMNAIRVEIEGMENEERERLQQSTQASENLSWLSYAVIFAGTVVGLIVFLFALLGMNHAVSERVRSEARLNFALQKSRIGAWELDLVDHTAHRTLIHDRIFGYRTLLPLWTYEIFLEHVLPEDRAEVDRQFREATAAQTDWAFECRIRRADGEIRWLWAAGGHERNPDGNLVRMSGIVQDITERKRAEEALRTSEERFRIAADTANDLVYEWDLKQSVQWPGKIDEMLGYEPGAFPRTLDGWAASLHPDDVEHTIAAVQAHLDGQVPYVAEYRMRRKDGVYRWWAARGAAARTPDGKPVRWIGSITDVTERKDAEAALRESESRFRQLAESLPQLVWTCQPDGPCDYLNRQWIEFTGVPEARQQGFGWLEQLHPDDRAPTVAAWESAVASGTDFRVEFRIRRHDGEYRWFDTQAARLRDAQGHTVKWFGSNTDITERKRAEEEILRLNSDLELRVAARTAELTASNKELDSFAYAVAHDLRAPLRGIDGFAKVLEEDCAGRLDEEGRDALHRVRSAAQRMGELIDDLLTLSHLTRADMTMETLDLCSLARPVIAEFARREPARRVTFEMPARLKVRGDRRLLAVLLDNLLSNAWKFTGKHARASIELGVRQHEGKPAYFVRDDGAGFDMAHAANLFAPFQRLHSAHDFLGTGIGLATVRRIVQRHGGQVWADAAIDKGATFYFTLSA